RRRAAVGAVRAARRAAAAGAARPHRRDGGRDEHPGVRAGDDRLLPVRLPDGRDRHPRDLRRLHPRRGDAARAARRRDQAQARAAHRGAAAADV
nr:hypothetical protein [Tanacetum cinerariifolium]